MVSVRRGRCNAHLASNRTQARHSWFVFGNLRELDALRLDWCDHFLRYYSFRKKKLEYLMRKYYFRISMSWASKWFQKSEVKLLEPQAFPGSKSGLHVSIVHPNPSLTRFYGAEGTFCSRFENFYFCKTKDGKESILMITAGSADKLLILARPGFLFSTRIPRTEFIGEMIGLSAHIAANQNLKSDKSCCLVPVSPLRWLVFMFLVSIWNLNHSGGL